MDAVPAISRPHPETAAGRVEVHYWAAARAAAGVNGDLIDVAGAITLAELVTEVTARHHGPRLREVLHVCSVLVDGRQAGNRDPAEVWIQPGQSVEFLPPFAGG